MRRLLVGLASLTSFLAATAWAALPVPPDQVAYSGVLVDGGGVPLAGPVDLGARIYDAASGGSLVFKQSFTGVALTDGHYALNLGPTGAATDSPTDPLTTSLRTALTGDLAAGAGRFVEITVNSDPPLARVALVLVPYALRADHATTADVATNALDAQALGGLDSAALTEIFEHVSFDGGNPPNDDPSEGTGDADGDGFANFVDSNNDNDALSDSTEVSQGSNINLVTPTITTVTPSSGDASTTTPVTIAGTGFLPGATVSFGAQAVVPSSLTPTSLQAGAGPLAGVFGSQLVDVTVLNANGEDAMKLNGFTFIESAGAPGPVPVPFTILSTASPVSISVQGNDETLAYGSQHPTTGNAYAVDTIADLATVFDVSAAVTGRVPNALGWNASRVLHGFRANATTNQIQFLRDANANRLLESSEAVLLDGTVGTPNTRSPSLAFDGAGRPGGGYIRTGTATITAMAFHDRDGNGVFTGTNELVAVETAGSVQTLGDAQFDLSGRLAYVFYNSTLGAIRVAWDRSGDGDFADTVGTPELGSAAAIAVPSCLGASFDGSGRLGIVYVVSGNPVALYDWNGDTDFLDAGESSVLPGSGLPFGCDVTRSAASGRLVFVFNRSSELRMSVDTNDDNDFADAADFTLLSSSVSAPLSVGTNASGAVRVLAPQGVFLGPVR